MYEFLARSALHVPTVEEAIHERQQARDDLDALIEGLVPVIGQAAANRLSDAATNVVARVELEVITRLFVLAGAIAGGPTDMIVGPEPEDDDA